MSIKPINVSFSDPPIVTLRLGSTLSDNIKEGDDVYFECLAVANPQWRKLYWLHDVSKKKIYIRSQFFSDSILPPRFLVIRFAFYYFAIQHFILLILLHDFIEQEMHKIYVYQTPQCLNSF